MPQNQPGNPEMFIDMYVGMLNTMLTETRYLSLSLTPTSELCRFDVTYAALADTDLRIGRVLHPSPASPKANRGWEEQAAGDFAALGVEL